MEMREEVQLDKLRELLDDDREIRRFVEEVYFDNTELWEKIVEIFSAFRGSEKALVALTILGELNVIGLTNYYEEVMPDAM